MAPYGLGGAAGEGAGDVHPVRSFQEDDLGSQGVVVEPAAGGGHRDGGAGAVGVVRDGPGPGGDGNGQRVGRLDEADLPAAGLRCDLDGGQGRLDLSGCRAGGDGERPAGPRAPAGGSRRGGAGGQLKAGQPGTELVVRGGPPRALRSLGDGPGKAGGALPSAGRPPRCRRSGCRAPRIRGGPNRTPGCSPLRRR